MKIINKYMPEIKTDLQKQIVLNAQKQIETWELFYSTRLTQIKKF